MASLRARKAVLRRPSRSAATCAMPRQGPITERQKQTTADGLVRVCVDCLRRRVERRLQNPYCAQLR